MKSRLLLVIIVLFVGIFAGQLKPESAEAQLSPLREGYFNGNHGPRSLIDISTVLTNGLMKFNYPTSGANPSVIMNPSNWAFNLTNKAEFINFIKYRLNGYGTAKDRTGAAFIIQNLRGEPGYDLGGRPNNPPTAAEIKEWEDLINLGSVSLQVDAIASEGINSAYMVAKSEVESVTLWQPWGRGGIPDSSVAPSSPYFNCRKTWISNIGNQTDQWVCSITRSYSAVNDDMFYAYSTSLPALSIKQNGVNILRIKINCGNIVGGYGGGTPQPASWNYTISNTNPGNQKVGNTFSIVSSLNNPTSTNGFVSANQHGHRIEITQGASLLSRTSGGGGNAPDNATDARWINFGPILAGTGVNRTGSWRAIAPGRVCYRGLVSPASGTRNPDSVTSWVTNTPTTCFDIIPNNWSYNTRRAGYSTPADGSSVLPGDKIRFYADVENSGNGSGPAYDQWIQVYQGTSVVRVTAVSGGSSYVNPAVDTTRRWTGGGIAAGANTTDQLMEVTVNNDASEGTSICIRSRVTPAAGVSGGATTDPGPRYSPANCYTVARNHYNYVPNTTVVGSHYPGSVLNVTGRINNTEPAGTGHPYTEQIYVNWGGAYVTAGNGSWNETGLSGGGNRTRGTNYTIANNAPHDELLCFTTSVDPNTGLATPGTTTDGGGPATDEYCFRVINERFAMTSTVTKTNTTGVVVPGQAADFSVFVTNNGDYKDRGSVVDVYPGAVPGRATGVNCTFTVSGTGATGGANGSTPCFSTPGWGADAFSGSVSVNVSSTADIGETVCLRVTGAPLNGFSDGADSLGTFDSQEVCYVVGVTPYFHVLNGDVWAGAVFDTQLGEPRRTCGTSPDAIIRSVTSGLSGAPIGSFVERAAFATGVVSGFGSDGAPNFMELIFANNPSLGEFTNDTKCIPNYYGLMAGSSDSVPITASSVNLTAGTYSDGNQYYKNSGNLTIHANSSGGGSSYAKNLSFVVNGDIIISANGANREVRYTDNYGNSSNLNVPSLVLVASGNIYIDASITRVDAILISHGNIWTCSTGGTPTIAVAKNVCNEELTINGALIANRINFMRTHEDDSGNTGGVHDGSSDPAEVINFLPEFYLSEPVFKSNYLSEDAFETLLIRDLPPIY